jgi:hypothetical protein
MSWDPADLAGSWADLWNGKLDLIEQIIHPDFRSHAAPLTGGAPAESHGRDSLGGWISAFHSLFQGVSFAIEVGPIVNGDFLVVRWKAEGTYGGGLPGASPDAVGRRITFTGTDTLRVADGLLAEYWANADSLYFVQQVGMEQVPPLEMGWGTRPPSVDPAP